MKRILELDGLRFFAILAVMAVHYRPPFRPGLDILSLGWVGVDLFFVISGYLITTILASLREDTHPYRVFYWRRTLRIFPPYYLVVILLLAQLRFAHQPITARIFGEPLLFLYAFTELHPLHLLLTKLLHGLWLDHRQLQIDNHILSTFQSGIGILWSLSFEEMFYLMWAPAMLKLSRRPLLIIIFLTIGTSPILRCLGHTQSFQEGFFFPFRFDTLAMGSLLALIFLAYGKGEISRQALQRGLIATGVISFCCLLPLAFMDGVFRHVELRSTLSFAAIGYSLLGICFSSLVGLCVLYAGSRAWWTRLLRAWPLVQIGTVSYMLYLIHIPIWVLLWKLASRYHGSAIEPTLWFGTLAGALSIALASLSWKFFERPILRFRDFFPSEPRKSVKPAVAEV